ncbi:MULTISPECIES: hypothetical protein [Actinoplanes]|uniref:hypothetical protein n=1 Tax=Actinoplanes TaxID=1865 RepID=UPI000B1052B6|nr:MULTISPECIES: hypothetical protein [Actinoplanes]GLY01356.1 hypothetical protein Acsp01_17350 [Actinoplanes sp. NBRC 101535]
MELPTAYLSSLRDMNREVLSARPDAPVVPHVERTARAPRIRLSLSRVLHRAAIAVAP